VQIDLIKGWTIAWPRLETEQFIMTIGFGTARWKTPPASPIANCAAGWPPTTAFEEIEAYMLLTQAGRGPARQHGRPEIHAGCVDQEVVLDFDGLSLAMCMTKPICFDRLM